MRTWTLVAGALVAAASGSAPAKAAADRLAFFGGLRVTAVSSVCTTEDAASVGETALVVFQRDLRNGTTRDNLRLDLGLSDFSFVALDVQGNRAAFGASGDLQAVYIFSRGNVGVQEAAYSNFALTPAKISATTPTVKITGKISDFDVEGCTVTFEAMTIRRPD